jgi:hypothetical protein
MRAQGLSPVSVRIRRRGESRPDRSRAFGQSLFARAPISSGARSRKVASARNREPPRARAPAVRSRAERQTSITERNENIEHLFDDGQFPFVEQHLCEPFGVESEVDCVMRLRQVTAQQRQPGLPLPPGGGGVQTVQGDPPRSGLACAPRSADRSPTRRPMGLDGPGRNRSGVHGGKEGSRCGT